MRRCRCGIERFELFGNRVQAREDAAIVVLIVALDEPWRDAQKCPRPAEQGCDLISHVDVSRICLRTPRRRHAQRSRASVPMAPKCSVSLSYVICNTCIINSLAAVRSPASVLIGEAQP